MGDDSVFELEALLRAVVGQVAEKSLGGGWVTGLSRATQRDLQANLERVKRVRPGAPDNGWTVAGLVQIQTVLVNLLDSPPDGFDTDLLSPLWKDGNQCRLDLGRVIAARPDEAHPGVTAPVGSADRELVVALIRRIRLAAEAVRRSLLQEHDEWWPFIKQVASPGVPEWQYVRGSKYPSKSRLVVGDHIELRVVGVNPQGSDQDLEFALLEQPGGGSLLYASGWQDSPVLQCFASREGRTILFLAVIRDRTGVRSGGDWDDEVGFEATVTPDPRRSTR